MISKLIQNKTMKGLSLAVMLGAGVSMSGCFPYRDLPRPMKKVVRNSWGILWPSWWREPAREDREKKNTNSENYNSDYIQKVEMFEDEPYLLTYDPDGNLLNVTNINHPNDQGKTRKAMDEYLKRDRYFKEISQPRGYKN